MASKFESTYSNLLYNHFPAHFKSAMHAPRRQYDQIVIHVGSHPGHAARPTKWGTVKPAVEVTDPSSQRLAWHPIFILSYGWHCSRPSQSHHGSQW